jgi:predicted AAA+ superfamily ATPase
MYLERKVDLELVSWKESKSRKPLILRGARQVGKSSAVRNIGKKFKYFLEINLDENTQLRTLFENELTVLEIVEQLAVITNTPIISGETLLFIDEIQASIPAISTLRYFYEKLPDLHVIAAGSLLEFALSEIPSFGVGRIRYVFMYPFSFEEFLVANKEIALLNVLNKATTDKPLAPIFHAKLKKYLKKFLIIGGMPEAVKTYVSNGDLLEVQRVLDDLILSIQADFSKYKNRVPALRIKEVFDAVVQQIGYKFSYSYPNATLTNIQIKEALLLLEMAGLLYSVTHSASNGIPLGAEINTKKRKILLFDTGIYQRILGLDIGILLLEDDVNIVNRGNIAELFVGLELLKNTSCYEKNDLYYWQREAKSSQAEVDYVIQRQEKIIPLEIKAGTKGSMQSMFLFLNEKKGEFGIRLSMENFSEMNKVKIYPLYAVRNIVHNS